MALVYGASDVSARHIGVKMLMWSIPPPIDSEPSPVRHYQNTGYFDRLSVLRYTLKDAL
jgi:hypothetical protein